MSLTVKELYEENKTKFEFKIIAGENGLYRKPSWLYFSEDIENISFLEGGELILITGFSSLGPNWLYQYVRGIEEAGCCGLIINTGKYIRESDIPANVIEFCNEHNFPLITMPWKIHLAVVTQTFCKRIFENNQYQDDLTYIFMSLLHNNPLHEKESALLEQAHFLPNDSYTVVVFSIHPNSMTQHVFLNHFEEFLAIHKLAAPHFIFENTLCVIFSNASLQSDEHIETMTFSKSTTQCKKTVLFSETVADYIEQLLNSFLQKQTSYAFCKDLSFGIGQTISSREKLHQSYTTACETLYYAQTHQTTYANFEHLGIYQLFITASDKSIISSFYNCLLPIIEYDTAHSSDLLLTLYLYIMNGKSIQKVSDHLFCHRNTINYRIAKIKELLPFNIANETQLFDLQLAFQALQYDKKFTFPSIS